MKKITHIFHIEAPFEAVFNALTTIGGLSSWWTKDTSGDASSGGIITFKFGEMAEMQMKVLAVDTNKFVHWKNISGMPQWIDTQLSFELSENENKVRIKFSHDGFRNVEEDFLAAINFSWGRYLVSLRSYCEAGIGDPFSE